MNRNLGNRIEKLEVLIPERPSPIDGMTISELTVFILQECSALLACDDISEECRICLKKLQVAGAASDGRYRLVEVAIPAEFQ
jgi:hypothetical protein